MNTYALESYEIKHVDTLNTRARSALDLAIEEASAAGSNFRHGAVCFKRGAIYGFGHNDNNKVISWARAPQARVENKNFKCQDKYFSTHAEIAALHNVNADCVVGSTLLVVRITKSNELALSEPCSKCLFVLKKRGIRKCIFSIGPDIFGILTFKK